MMTLYIFLILLKQIQIIDMKECNLQIKICPIKQIEEYPNT